jgi:sugar phosphate permease
LRPQDFLIWDILVAASPLKASPEGEGFYPSPIGTLKTAALRGADVAQELLDAGERLLLLLAVSLGFAFFDRNAVSYLSTHIVQDLKINNTQAGLLGTALSLSWAISDLTIGRRSGAVGGRRPFLVAILPVSSACSIHSGLATSFYMLLAARSQIGIKQSLFPAML